MNYSVTDFRKNIREALNAVESGKLVTIKRHDKTFIVMTMWDYNQAIVEAAKDGVSRLVTDEVSSNIRPDLKKIADLPDGKIKLVSTPVEPNPFAVVPPRDKTPDTEVKNLDDEFVEAGKRVGGLPCCLKAKPCQHWQWDTDNAQWVNILSGEKRDA